MYQLRGMLTEPEDQEEALNKIIAASLASQLQDMETEQGNEGGDEVQEMEQPAIEG